jgi:succinyl-diaminopimelate desuccinylase
VKVADLDQLTAIYRRFIERYFEAFAGGSDGG